MAGFGTKDFQLFFKSLCLKEKDKISLMSFVKSSILFSNTLYSIIKENPFVVCDVGGRGTLVEPWKSLHEVNPKMVNIIGFEPDENECSRLNSMNQGKYFPYALWNSNQEISLNVADKPSTSSIHPPNLSMLKENYNEQQWKPRITKKIDKVPAKTLDEVIESTNHDIDFIKIDTQGSEFEIIQGSEKTLMNNCFGITLETWTIGVHQNQRLSFDLMKLMNEFGFLFFDLQIGASWKRKFGNRLLKSKGQVVGIDFLYFKNPDIFFQTNPSIEKVAKAAAISDVWGFPHYSIQLIELYKKNFSNSSLDPLKSEITRLRTKNKIILKWDKFMWKFFNVNPPFPNIH